MTPFYKKALSLFTKTQEQQIQKGLAKYPNPFNPHDWTPEELLNHALEETVDLTHYLVGLKELLDRKDVELKRCFEIIEEQDEELNNLKNITKFKMDKDGNLVRVSKKSPFEEQYDMNFNPHFDQDDQ